jgi:XTP/dITP diphosphohydrolase
MAFMELVFATNNPHKLREIRGIIGNAAKVISLSEAGLEGEIPETEATLEGNAHQKARYVWERIKRNCFSDDTGLEVEALQRRPGVYSARYAGEGCTFDDNIRKLLEELSDKKDLRAAFRTVICLVRGGKEFVFEGRIDGQIARERTGDGGFGYDPIFIPDGNDRSFAELSEEEKNRISHRGRAVSLMLKFLATAK